MYLKDKLINGTKVVMENIPYVNSVSVGVLINTGSVNEDKDINGLSHFIEHMLFKGTQNRTAKELAEIIDNVGGHVNAYTGTEYTCFYVKVLDKHLITAIDVLSDMLNNPKFGNTDIENEKKVILEEINMYLDSPEDLVYDILSEIMFEGTSLALPILGTKNSITNFDYELITKYYNKYYTPENMVVSIVGNFDAEETIKILNQHFNKDQEQVFKNNSSIVNLPMIKQKIKGKQKDVEQLNFCLGMEGVKSRCDDVYSLSVINNILGGSMSSRLFQKIREDKGLAYSVYSYPIAFQNTGMFSIYAALSSDQIINVANLISEDINNLKKSLITKDELNKSKEQLKSNYILGMESTFNRMIDIGRSELLLGKILSPEDKINKIDKVNIDDVERVILKVFDNSKYNIAYVGNISNQNEIDLKLKEIFF